MMTLRTSLLSLPAALGLFLLGTGCSSPESPASTSAQQPTPVALNPSPTNPEAKPPSEAFRKYVPASEGDLQRDTHYGYVIAKTSPNFDAASFTREGLSVQGHFAGEGCQYFLLHKAADILKTLERIQKTPGVLFAEPELKRTLFGGITFDNPDPKIQSEEYSVYVTKLMDAWKTFGFGPNRPVVVDVDTGVNWSHEDFQLPAGGSMVKHAYSWWDYSNGSFISGYADPTVQPIDYINTTQTSTDEEGHGSHTAGSICAQGNNGKGVAGVCWQADLFSYKCFSNWTGSGSDWAIYGSLHHLTQWKLSTGYSHTIPVNFSLGGQWAGSFEVDMLQEALKNNIVVICSMGNDGQRLSDYPAAYPGVIAVGATNGQDKKVHFSTLGPHISISAPGYDIISTGNATNSAYLSESGTSMAAPFVTGLVTYMLTFNPDLNPAQIKTYLERNADDIDALGFDEGTGWGRVNALRTIQAVVNDVSSGTAPVTNYVNATLQTTVATKADGVTTPVPGANAYLYECDATGGITNYVASSSTNADGNALFGLLKPGHYLVTSVVGGHTASTPVVAVSADQTSLPAQSITFNLKSLYIETLPDAGNCSNTDDIITVYDTAGTLLLQYDRYTLDTAQIYLTPGQSYVIGIAAYQNFTGEYALYVSSSLYGQDTAPGSWAAPVGTPGSQSNGAGTPQAISLDTVYNSLLGDAPNYYQITLP